MFVCDRGIHTWFQFFENVVLISNKMQEYWPPCCLPNVNGLYHYVNG